VICLQAKELAPLLQSSPSTLPFPPRIVYTSSGTANHDSLKPDPLNDYQLLTYAYQEPDGLGNYAASKYMGDLIMVQLDRELVHKNTRPHDRPPIRCLTAEPGIVCTNIFEKGLGPWRWLRTVLWLNYWMCLYFVSPPDSPLLSDAIHRADAIDHNIVSIAWITVSSHLHHQRSSAANLCRTGQ